MTHSEAEELAGVHGDAFYVYDEARFAGNFRALLSSFRRFYQNTQIAYSYKTNYTPAICRKVDELGGYAEVVSAMEYALARRIGVASARIVYNGPWKSAASLREALSGGSIVNLDSDRDLAGLQQAATEFPSAPMRVGIRCNFELEGHPDSRFGFDVEGESFGRVLAGVRRLPNARLAGLHCHFPHRDLHSFAGRAKRMMELCGQVFEAPPEFVSIGGGFFGHLPEVLRRRYPEGVPAFEDYAQTVGKTIADVYGNTEQSPVLFVEPGTALVADAFRFVARVIDIKQVRSRRVACVAGSMFNTSPYARTQDLPLEFLRRFDRPESEAPGTHDIVGYTCIEGDVMARGVTGPLAVGDFVVFRNVGSYSIVMKPPFILPSVPILMYPEDGGGIRLIKRAESMEYVFENFVF